MNETAPPLRPRLRRRAGLLSIVLAALTGLAWLAGPGGQDWLWPLTPFANVLHVLTALALLLGLTALLAGQRVLGAALALPTLLLLVWSAPRLATASAEPDPAPAGGADLTLACWNLGSAVASPDEAAAWIAASDADVVALCELNPAVAARLEAEFAERFPHRVLYPLGIPGRGVLSRFPLLGHEFTKLEGRRRHLRVLLDVDGRPLRLDVVHLALSAALLGSAEGSVRDVEVLTDGLLDGPPGLLVGDFNSSETSALYADLSGRLVDTFRESGAGLGFSFPLPGRYKGLPLPPFVRIDHIWRTDGLRSLETWVGPDGGSDHLPVTTRLRFTDRASEADATSSSR